MAECELASSAFLTNKLDHAGHRNTFDIKFEKYKGDVMGTTLRNMVEKRYVLGGYQKKVPADS